MKKKIIISLLLYALGIEVGIILLFPFAGETQISIIFGIFALILSVLSLIYGIILMNNRKKNKYVIITSKLTILYKFYIPIFTIDILIFNTILLLFNIYPEKDISVFVVVEIMLVLWILLLLPCIKLYQIYLKDDNIIIDNYLKINVFNKNEVKEIKRFFVFFYKIKLNNTSFIIFPKFLGIINLFVTPKSIRIFKNLI